MWIWASTGSFKQSSRRLQESVVLTIEDWPLLICWNPQIETLSVHNKKSCWVACLCVSGVEECSLKRLHGSVRCCQAVTKRCRLSWLTKSALVYEPKCGGREVFAGSQLCTGTSKNLGDLAPYFTFRFWADCLPRTESLRINIHFPLPAKTTMQSWRKRRLYCSLILT